MEVTYKRTFAFYIFIILVHTGITAAEDLDSNSTSFKDINPLMLLKMGRQLNKPLLTLIGMAMTNLHPCAQWTTWSGCTAASLGHIGIRKRTRLCNGGDNLKESFKVKTETDFQICEGKCPNDYNLTSNGYCLKFDTTSKNQEGAEKQCNVDGGHLINVNSDLKYADFKTVRKGYKSSIYISGRRKAVNSPWIGSDGSPVEFIKWSSGQPDNASNQLCLLIGGNNFWYDVSCTSGVAFMCEIKS